MKILGLSGSLRKQSYNTALLHAARDLVPAGTDLDIHSYHDLPPYNADDDGDAKPAGATLLLDAIKEADALIIATPEYNYGIPGVLKNAIDWASRPAFKSVLAGKPAGMLSASMSPVGGARAQSHLRQVLSGTLTPIFPHVEMLVPSVQDKIGSDGALTDEVTRARLEKYLAALVVWAQSQQA